MSFYTLSNNGAGFDWLHNTHIYIFICVYSIRHRYDCMTCDGRAQNIIIMSLFCWIGIDMYSTISVLCWSKIIENRILSKEIHGYKETEKNLDSEIVNAWRLTEHIITFALVCVSDFIMNEIQLVEKWQITH